ncbi:hypothetical protein NPIL_66341, partial [Nephila pilipes]
ESLDLKKKDSNTNAIGPSIFLCLAKTEIRRLYSKLPAPLPSPQASDSQTIEIIQEGPHQNLKPQLLFNMPFLLTEKRV